MPRSKPACPACRHSPVHPRLVRPSVPILLILALVLLAMMGSAAPSLANRGIWLTDSEILALPLGGAAWDSLKAQADRPAGTPDLSNQDQNTNVYVLAKALVYVRTGLPHYRTEVRDACMAAIDTEIDGRTLALGRELAAYVIAADLVGMKPASQDPYFKDWLRRTLTETLEDKTLQSTHEVRANNWGTMCGASRAAVAIYLQDDAELARTAQVFKGYLGDRTSYAGFEFSDLSWQPDTTNPVAIAPAGATKYGQLVGGTLPEEMARGCGFQMPPCHTGYPWEALQGAVVQAEILSRQGYDAWNWQDQALRRAVQFLFDLNASYGGWWAEGDDQWVPWLVNAANGTSFPVSYPALPGKIMGWTDWTHVRPAVSVARAEGPPLRLERPSPLPASHQVSISFSIPQPGQVRLEVFDVSGRCIAKLLDQWLSAGAHVRPWSLSSQSSGVYLIRLSHAGQQRSLRVPVLR
jgi:alginate lyase